MRAIIFILIVAVIALVAALATGFLNINQTRGARAPEVSTTHNGVTAKGGQAPAFEVETGSVSVGSSSATVKVPSLKVQPAAPAGNQAAAQPANDR